MTKKIFKNTIFIVIIAAMLCGVSITFVLYHYFNRQYTESLDNEAIYIANGVELSGMDFLDHLNQQTIRITWIDTDGTVLYDNQADAATMDNHKDREEIRQAMLSSAGNSVRYSTTLSEKTIYHAIRIANGSVVRVAATQKSVPAIVVKVIAPIVFILIMSVVLSAFLAYRLSHQIMAPLEAIDLDHPTVDNVYDEMTPFIHKIKLQNKEIQDTMQRLQTQKHEFQMITENMQEGFLVIDRQAIILSHNQSVSRLFDTEASMEGKHVLEVNRSEQFITCIEKAISGIHSEYICQIKNRYYNIFANPVMRENSIAGAVVIMSDVTEKEQRDNLRREFSANVSHELKTPLTSISGIAEIIKNGIVDKKDVKTFAGKIYDEASRLIHLVEDIIKLSQLDEGKQGIEMLPLNLYALTEMELTHLETIAASKHITLHLEGEAITINGISSILEEMIYNLIENAIKYNKENGSVEIRIYKEEARGVFLIKDTGIGIPSDQLDRIFERFYRVDKSHSKEIGGTGLGLSIVKHGAEIHHAKIKIESTLQRGTEIKLEFPIPVTCSK